jgi:hypothetical protein
MTTTIELGEQIAASIRGFAGPLTVVGVEVEATDDRDGLESINLNVTLPDPPAGRDTWHNDDVLEIRRAVRHAVTRLGLELPVYVWFRPESDPPQAEG